MLTYTDCAAALACSYRTVLRLVATGVLPTVKTKLGPRIPALALRLYLISQKAHAHV
jgi:excisionase family DNA binding protein